MTKDFNNNDFCRDPKKATAYWEIVRVHLKYLWSETVANYNTPGVIDLFDLITEDVAMDDNRHTRFRAILQDDRPSKEDTTLCTKETKSAEDTATRKIEKP